MQSDYTLYKLFYTILTLIQFKGHLLITFSSGYHIFSDFNLNFSLIALCKTKISYYTALKTVVKAKLTFILLFSLSSLILFITLKDSDFNADYKSNPNYTEAQS